MPDIPSLDEIRRYIIAELEAAYNEYVEQVWREMYYGDGSREPIGILEIKDKTRKDGTL